MHPIVKSQTTMKMANTWLPYLGLLIACTNAPVLSGQVIYTNGENNKATVDTLPSAPLVLTIGSGTATQSGIIEGPGSVNKTGNGTLILTAANTYAGAASYPGGTIVSFGSLVLDAGSIDHPGQPRCVGFYSGDNGSI